MDILDISLAANKAIRSLEESGRIGGEKRTPIYLLSIESLSFREGAADALVGDSDNPDHKTQWGENYQMKPGMTVIVNFDGVRYSCVTEEADKYFPGQSGVVFGNIGAAQPDLAEDTGEPFCVQQSFYGVPAFLVMCIEDVKNGVESSTHKVEIYAETETIHPIDPKFLPGVCLPVVDLETTITNGATLTDAENAALNKAAEQMVPIIVRFTIAGGIPLSLMFQCAILGKNYGVVFGDLIVEFTKDDDNGPWNIMVDGL